MGCLLCEVAGDFRGHGRKAVLFEQMLEKPPQNIDCLLIEGSSLGREDVRYKTEVDVQKRLEEILKERKNIRIKFLIGHVKALSPKALILIHAFHAETYRDYFSNVNILQDKEMTDRVLDLAKEIKIPILTARS